MFSAEVAVSILDIQGAMESRQLSHIGHHVWICSAAWSPL